MADINTNAADTVSADSSGPPGAVWDDNLGEYVVEDEDRSISSTGGNTGISIPIENKLSKFASYNYIFTFGPLTNTELNFPDATYRKNGPSIILIRSGGTGDKQVQHFYDKQHGVRTEYFIDEVEIETLIAPNPKTKQTNATSINFQVIEPYSMGLFLKSLQTAAMQVNPNSNYIEVPFLLTVEFIGWDDEGRYTTIPQTKRMFPLKLASVSFSVTESGSVYDVSAIPWQETAFADEIQMLQTDLDLEGETLLEMLQTGPNSLASQLNTRQVEQENAKNKVTGDQYVILFPTQRSSIDEQLAGESENNAGATTTSGQGEIRELTDEQKSRIFQSLSGIEGQNLPEDFDTELNKLLGVVVTRSALGETIREFAEDEANTNKIGLSKIAKSYLDGGKTYFGKPAFVEDENNSGVFKRGDIVISGEAKKIQFPKGAKIQDVIEELILLSEYGRQFVSETPDSVGMKKWFKIEANVFNVTDPENVAQTGKTPKVFVYRVIPYGVHAGRTAGPTQVPPGYKELVKQALKEYNYIYTGKNDDIINFNIEINTAFYLAVMGDYGQQHADAVAGGRNKIAADTPSATPGLQEGTDVTSETGTKSVQETTKTSSGGIGSGAEVSSETQIARSLNDAIVNSPTDLVAVDLEIWGDPYYIADSGMGNYNASELAGVMNMTIDGGIDYQSSEVDIVINFRTPLDIGNDGNMIFPELGSKPIGAFSGLYQVLSVDNKFSGGKFIQVLKTIRRSNQPSDTNDAAPTGTGAAFVEKAGAALAPLPDQSVGPGQFIPEGFDVSAASIGGKGGISIPGDVLSEYGIDLSAAKDFLNGKIPDGVNNFAKDIANNITQSNTDQKVWDDNLGDYI